MVQLCVASLNGVAAIFIEQRHHPLLTPAARRCLRFQIPQHIVWCPHVSRDKIEQLCIRHAGAVQFHTGEAHPLLVYFRTGDTHAPRKAATDVGVVLDNRREAKQIIAPKDRHNEDNIGEVGHSPVRIVGDNHVSFLQLAAKLL